MNNGTCKNCKWADNYCTDYVICRENADLDKMPVNWWCTEWEEKEEEEDG